MLIQNKNSKKYKSIPAHGGQGLIHMKFFHQEFQRFRDIDDLPDPDPSCAKTMWNFIAYAELPVGSTIGRHEHVGNDEFYIVISGEAEMEIDNEFRTIKTGDIILTRSGSYHAISKVVKKLKFYAFEVMQDG